MRRAWSPADYPGSDGPPGAEVRVWKRNSTRGGVAPGVGDDDARVEEGMPVAPSARSATRPRERPARGTPGCCASRRCRLSSAPSLPSAGVKLNCVSQVLRASASPSLPVRCRQHRASTRSASRPLRRHANGRARRCWVTATIARRSAPTPGCPPMVTGVAGETGAAHRAIASPRRRPGRRPAHGAGSAPTATNEKRTRRTAVVPLVSLMTTGGPAMRPGLARSLLSSTAPCPRRAQPVMATEADGRDRVQNPPADDHVVAAGRRTDRRGDRCDGWRGRGRSLCSCKQPQRSPAICRNDEDLDREPHPSTRALASRHGQPAPKPFTKLRRDGPVSGHHIARSTTTG